MAQPGVFTFRPDTLVLDYWRIRLVQSNGDTYRGLPLVKLPEDLRTYEHLIEETRPEVIVELGMFQGGSALWFADRLDTLCGGGRVITLEINKVSDFEDPRVDVIYGDLRDHRIAEQVRNMVAGRRCMVVEDSAHTYDTTLDALGLYAPMVTKGCWFVVEDGFIDDPLINHDGIWQPGDVQAAVNEFIRSPFGSRFSQHNRATYGITGNHNGWLFAEEDDA